MRGGPGIPCTRPGQAGAPGVEPPDPLRSPSLSVLPLLRSSPGLRKSVSWEVNPESWDEIEERRRGAARGGWPCQGFISNMRYCHFSSHNRQTLFMEEISFRGYCKQVFQTLSPFCWKQILGLVATRARPGEGAVCRATLLTLNNIGRDHSHFCFARQRICYDKNFVPDEKSIATTVNYYC